MCPASREIPSEFSCASGIFAKRYNRSSDRAVLGMLVLRWKPCLWRLRFAIGGLASGGPLASSGCLVRWPRFRPAHAQGGASREKASITPRIAEGAELRDNITSGANNDNSTGDNPPPPLGPPPGEECCRLVNYHVRFVVEMFVNRMMFIDMFVNRSASINWRGRRGQDVASRHQNVFGVHQYVAIRTIFH